MGKGLIRFVASMYGFLYFLIGLGQTFSIYGIMDRFVELPRGISHLVAFAVGELPLVGSVAGVYGVVYGWELSIWIGLVLFVWPPIIVILYIAEKRRQKALAAEDEEPGAVEPTAAPKPGETRPVRSEKREDRRDRGKDESPARRGGVEISPWAAGILKQLDEEERGASSSKERDVTPPAGTVSGTGNERLPEREGGALGENPLLEPGHPKPEPSPSAGGVPTEPPVADRRPTEDSSEADISPESDGSTGSDKDDIVGEAKETGTAPEKKHHDEFGEYLVDRIEGDMSEIDRQLDASMTKSLSDELKRELAYLYYAVLVNAALSGETSSFPQLERAFHALSKDERVGRPSPSIFRERAGYYQTAIAGGKTGHETSGMLFSRKVGRASDYELIRHIDDRIPEIVREIREQVR